MYFRTAAVALFASTLTLVQAQTYTGDGTYFAPGLGACGITNTASDPIVAVGYQTFDNYPGATPNPNLNPICNRQIAATYNGVTVIASITDRCAGCPGAADLDFSPELFDQLAPESVGRLHGVTWNYI